MIATCSLELKVSTVLLYYISKFLYPQVAEAVARAAKDDKVCLTVGGDHRYGCMYSIFMIIAFPLFYSVFTV